MSKTSTAIDTKDITQISKSALPFSSNVAQILSDFTLKLSSCPKSNDKSIIDQETETELLKLYSKLPWTEQLKLRISNASFLLFVHLLLFRDYQSSFSKMAKPARERIQIFL